MGARELSCRELVEHLGACDGCAGSVRQVRAIIRSAGRLREEGMDASLRDALLVAFRGGSCRPPEPG